MGSTAWWMAGTLATLAAVGFVALLVRGGARPYEAERALARSWRERAGRPRPKCWRWTASPAASCTPRR
ncbi:hypothetical protein [Bordetella bronchiseptica]|uniref:hypothetical protein n=1 Tax=Bordetella bronchiseptica TaxID=518 RepID=UPI000305F9DC|nr:hypothetical protein [Bordetella bronchiseptica]